MMPRVNLSGWHVVGHSYLDGKYNKRIKVVFTSKLRSSYETNKNSGTKFKKFKN